MNRTIRYPLFLLMLAAGTAGCDKELLAGGQGEVEVTATDSPPPEPSENLSHVTEPEPSTQVVAQILEGTVEIQATATLVHTSGDEIAVIATPVTAVVPIGAGESVSLGRRSIPEGRYTIARIDFTSVRATLTAGPDVIGTKIVDVDIGPQPRSVERLLNLVVGVTEAEVLEIDLNASTWLLLEQSGLVNFADFSEALRVRVVP